ncbi:MAG: hypothetical protein AB1397_00380 [bacterium]
MEDTIYYTSSNKSNCYFSFTVPEDFSGKLTLVFDVMTTYKPPWWIRNIKQAVLNVESLLKLSLKTRTTKDGWQLEAELVNQLGLVKDSQLIFELFKGKDIVWEQKVEIGDLTEDIRTIEGIDLDPSLIYFNQQYQLKSRFDFDWQEKRYSVYAPTLVLKLSNIVDLRLKTLMLHWRYPLEGEIFILNNGDFKEDLNVTISIPDLGFISTQSITLLPAGTAAIPFNPIIPETIEPGKHNIYLRYQLPNGSFIEKGFGFVLPQSNLGLILEKIDYLAGEVGSITVRNRGGVDTTYEYYGTLSEGYYGGKRVVEFIGTGTVKADGSSTICFSIPTWITEERHFLVVDYKDKRTGEERRLRKWLQLTGLIKLRVDKIEYLAGEAGEVIVDNTTAKDLEYDYLINLFKEESKVVEFAGTGSVQAGGSSTISFSAPVRMFDENYRIEVECIDKETGRSIKLEKEIYVSRLLELSLDKEDYLGGEIGSITVKNVGAVDSDYEYYGTISMGEWSSLFGGTGTVKAGGSATINFLVPVRMIEGWYGLELEIIDRASGESLNWSTKIKVRGLLELSLDKKDYLAGEIGSITVRNTSATDSTYEYYGTISTPGYSSGFSGTGTVKAISTSTINFFAPVRIVEEYYELMAEIKDKATGRSFRLEKEIKVSGLLKLILEKTEYSVGEEIEARLKNVGFQEKEINYTIRLADWYDREMAKNLGTETISPSESKPIKLTIPDQAVDGQYQLMVICKDSVYGDSITFERTINIAGLKGELTVNTNKEAYFLTEPITAKAYLNNQDGKIEDGSLSLGIYTGLEGWINYSFIKSVNSIVADGRWVWFGTDFGVSRYDKITGSWTNYTKDNSRLASDKISSLAIDDSVSDEISSLAVDDKDVWMGTRDGVARLNKITGSWTTYTTENSGLVDNDVRAIAVDGEDIWIGTEEGIARLNKATNEWATYTTENSGLLSDNITAIAVDKDDVWFGTIDGVLRLNKISGKWTAYTIKNSGLANNWIRAIAGDGIYVWFAGWEQSGDYGVGVSKGVSRLNKLDNTWITYTTKNSGLSNNDVGAIAIDGNDLWFGTDYSGVSRYNNEIWLTYNTENSELIDDHIAAIAGDDESVWFGTGEGVSRYQKRGKLIWKENFPVNLPEISNREISTLVGTLGITGKLYLKGELYSAFEQLIAQDEYGFYISPGTVTLTLETDKRTYKEGEPITISGEVKNWADLSTDELTLRVNIGTITIHTETFSLVPGGTHPFALTASADSSFILKGMVESPAIGTVAVAEYIEVEPSLLEVIIDAPDLVGRGTNSFRVIFENKGKEEVEINYQLAIGNGQLSEGSISIKAGESEVIEGEFSLLEDGTITLVLSGDVVGIYTKFVEFGEKVDI